MQVSLWTTFEQDDGAVDVLSAWLVQLMCSQHQHGSCCLHVVPHLLLHAAHSNLVDYMQHVTWM